MNNGGAPIAAPKPRSFWKDQVFWYVLALGFVFGGVFNYLPVTFPVFKQVFGCSLEQLGRTQLLFFTGGLLVSVIGGWFFGRVGLGRGTVVTLLGIVVSMVLIGSAPNYPTVLLGAACSGLSTYAVLVVGSAIINDFFPDRRQSVFFIFGIADALGATAGPTALGWWLAHAERTGGSWCLAYYLTAAVPLALMLWGTRLRTKIKAHEGAGATLTSARAELREVLTKPTIYIIGLAMFLHALAQMGMVSWVGQLYQKKHSIDMTRAALFISVNSAGFFVGRLLLSWVTGRWKIPEMIVLGTCAASGTVAFVTTLVAPTYTWGLVMFTFAGAFISGDVPPLNSYAGMRFARQSATAFALLAGASSLGAAAGPYLTGAIGQRLGLEQALWLMPVFSLALAGLAFGWFLQGKSRFALGR